MLADGQRAIEVSDPEAEKKVKFKVRKAYPQLADMKGISLAKGFGGFGTARLESLVQYNIVSLKC